MNTSFLTKPFYLIMILFFGKFLFSQDFPNIKFPSPQSYEMNKYIDFPVDLNSGLPEMSIL